MERKLSFIMERDSEINVIAVFCGHTHSNGGYKDITAVNMYMGEYNWNALGDVPFSWSTVYIETEKST